MLPLVLRRDGRGLRRVLCIGAHCDDIEIGCGATMLALQASRRIRIDWAVLSGESRRRIETRSAMAMLLRGSVRGDLVFGDFRDGHFPAQYADIKGFIEMLKRSRHPDLILCHERDDRHQDHRMTSDLVWTAFRDHVILEYEIPKWDGGLGQPNLYVPVTAAQARRKASVLLRAFSSQRRRRWFTGETFMGLMRLRGVECNSPGGYAEGFHARKLSFSGF